MIFVQWHQFLYLSNRHSSFVTIRAMSSTSWTIYTSSSNSSSWVARKRTKWCPTTRQTRVTLSTQRPNSGSSTTTVHSGMFAWPRTRTSLAALRHSSASALPSASTRPTRHLWTSCASMRIASSQIQSSSWTRRPSRWKRSEPRASVSRPSSRAFYARVIARRALPIIPYPRRSKPTTWSQRSNSNWASWTHPSREPSQLNKYQSWTLTTTNSTGTFVHLLCEK